MRLSNTTKDGCFPGHQACTWRRNPPFDVQPCWSEAARSDGNSASIASVAFIASDRPSNTPIVGHVLGPPLVQVDGAGQ